MAIPKYIYVGGITGRRVHKIDPIDMSEVLVSDDYGGGIYTIANNGNFIFCGGSTTQRVWKLNADDLVKVAESEVYTGRIEALTVIGNYIYCGGQDSTFVHKIWKIRISDMAKVGELTYGGRIWSLTNDGTYLYCGGDVTKKVWKIDPDTMGKLSESETYGYTICKVFSYGDYVYCGGATTNKVWKIRTSDMAKIDETSIIAGNGIYSITALGDYVFCGGWLTVHKVSKIRISDMAIIDQSADYGGPIIWALTTDGENIYCGGSTTRTVWQINPVTMLKIGESSYYGGDIITLDAIFKGVTLINTKAERDSTQTAIKLYGEITEKEETTVIEKGFEYIVQDEEPSPEATGIEVIKERPAWVEEWEIGEYNCHEYEGNDVAFGDRLYNQEENKIWWFRAYCKDDEENKYTAETWMKNVPTLITYRCSGGIGSISLGEGGTGYEVFDNINIIQEGASGGIAKVESVDEAGIIQSISIQSTGEDYKIGNGLSVTGGNGTGATINILSIRVEAQEVTANGELLDKGANIVTRRGFRIIKEYEGDLWGIREYDNSISDWTLEGKIEEEVITNEAGFITGYIWRGTFYRDALWPQSQTPGNFELGIYQNILGGGISGEGFGFYLKPNDTYKIRAISVNTLGMGFGNDGYAYTYQRLEGGNIGKDLQGKIDIGEWEEDGSGIWWKADNILQVDEIIKTGILILPSGDEIVSEISAEKTITLGTIPYGATVTRIGIRLGRTMGCNEIHVYEDGSWGTGGSVTFFITDFVPGSTYYKIPYIIINYGDWEEEILAIPDYRDPERLEEWLEDYPVEVFPEVEEEDEEELDQIITDSSVGDISYRIIIREIKCERIADQSFIDKAGRRRSQTIDNHLIQTRANCKIIVDDYIGKFQILKLKLLIDYDIPIPFGREDVILLGDGKEKYREDGQGLISFKADGEGEILQKKFILTKIRKIDGRYESGKELILGLELEV